MRDSEEVIVDQAGISPRFLFISGLLLMLNHVLVKVGISIVFWTVLSRDDPQASGMFEAFR